MTEPHPSAEVLSCGKKQTGVRSTDVFASRLGGEGGNGRREAMATRFICLPKMDVVLIVYPKSPRMSLPATVYRLGLRQRRHVSREGVSCTFLFCGSFACIALPQLVIGTQKRLLRLVATLANSDAVGAGVLLLLDCAYTSLGQPQY